MTANGRNPPPPPVLVGETSVVIHVLHSRTTGYGHAAALMGASS